MKIKLKRYYGDEGVTKSVVSIVGTDFRCEAREPGFRDYSASFPGASQFCLPKGVFVCKPIATDISPMTLTVMKAPAHRSCRFIYHPFYQTRSNSIVLGEADESVAPEDREINDSMETWETFQTYVYRAFEHEEEITLEVMNP